MDGVLGALIVIVGLLIVAWICDPAGHRDRTLRQEKGHTKTDEAAVRLEDR